MCGGANEAVFVHVTVCPTIFCLLEHTKVEGRMMEIGACLVAKFHKSMSK